MTFPGPLQRLHIMVHLGPNVIVPWPTLAEPAVQARIGAICLMEMEEVVRLLRGESGAGGAPLVVFQDSLGTVGGPALFATVIIFCEDVDLDRISAY